MKAHISDMKLLDPALVCIVLLSPIFIHISISVCMSYGGLRGESRAPWRCLGDPLVTF